MSADNYIGVYPSRDETRWIVCHGFMSPLDEDCMYRGIVLSGHFSRAEALIAAHDQMKKESIVEYGVIEIDAIPSGRCGECYYCLHRDEIESEV